MAVLLPVTFNYVVIIYVKLCIVPSRTCHTVSIQTKFLYRLTLSVSPLVCKGHGKWNKRRLLRTPVLLISYLRLVFDECSQSLSLGAYKLTGELAMTAVDSWMRSPVSFRHMLILPSVLMKLRLFRDWWHSPSLHKYFWTPQSQFSHMLPLQVQKWKKLKIWDSEAFTGTGGVRETLKSPW